MVGKAEKINRKHLYEDVQPYSCFFAECPLGNSRFRSRRIWFTHLILQHSFEPESKSLRCPLCLATNLGGEQSTVSHMSRHMEDIALAALTQVINSGTDFESETSSGLSAHEEMHYAPFSNPSGVTVRDNSPLVVSDLHPSNVSEASSGHASRASHLLSLSSDSKPENPGPALRNAATSQCTPVAISDVSAVPTATTAQHHPRSYLEEHMLDTISGPLPPVMPIVSDTSCTTLPLPIQGPDILAITQQLQMNAKPENESFAFVSQVNNPERCVVDFTYSEQSHQGCRNHYTSLTENTRQETWSTAFPYNDTAFDVHVQPQTKQPYILGKAKETAPMTSRDVATGGRPDKSAQRARRDRDMESEEEGAVRAAENEFKHTEVLKQGVKKLGEERKSMQRQPAQQLAPAAVASVHTVVQQELKSSTPTPQPKSQHESTTSVLPDKVASAERTCGDLKSNTLSQRSSSCVQEYGSKIMRPLQSPLSEVYGTTLSLPKVKGSEPVGAFANVRYGDSLHRTSKFTETATFPPTCGYSVEKRLKVHECGCGRVSAIIFPGLRQTFRGFALAIGRNHR